MDKLITGLSNNQFTDRCYSCYYYSLHAHKCLKNPPSEQLIGIDDPERSTCGEWEIYI